VENNVKSRFDHIEVHVVNIKSYCEFLTTIFEGGSYRKISESGTSMFTSPDGINVEVKLKKTAKAPIMSGFCNPCLRRSGAQQFIQSLGFRITKERKTPEGMVYFFEDHEGITWHIKDISE